MLLLQVMLEDSLVETLANLESFVRSAEGGSFSAAARRMRLTPAAVSRNVAVLERNLGIRLFHRSTRKLTLTDAGARFLAAITGNLGELQAAIADAAAQNDAPAGVLKVSLPPTIGIRHILPLLPSFLAKYPGIQPEWHFENRPVDLFAESYDSAIGGAFELAPGVVSRTLAPVHVVAVASPAYLVGRPVPANPSNLAAYAGIVMRSSLTGRVRHWMFRDASGAEAAGVLAETVITNDPAAMREAARLGLGVALMALADVRQELKDGDLVRVLPRWYADGGVLSIYYASRKLVSARTRVFVDFIVSAFKSKRLATVFSANHRSAA